MLWTIFVILLILWLVGMVSSYTVGGFIHLLLVLALVVLFIGSSPRVNLNMDFHRIASHGAERKFSPIIRSVALQSGRARRLFGPVIAEEDSHRC